MTAPVLSDIQEIFWQAITHPTGVAAFLAQTTPEARALFERTFDETEDFKRLERVSVYADAYFYRLHDVLAEVFPMLRHLIGSARFHNLVTDYLLAHPSSAPNLHALGQALPAFAVEHPALSAFAAAQDVARVELALHHALDAADDTVLRLEALAAKAPQDLNTTSFRLVQSATLLDCSYNPRPLHEARASTAPPPELAAQPAGSGVLVWRKGFTPHFRWLTALEMSALGALAAGLTFEAMCEVLQPQGATPAQVAGYLQRWLRDAVLAAD